MRTRPSLAGVTRNRPDDRNLTLELFEFGSNASRLPSGIQTSTSPPPEPVARMPCALTSAAYGTLLLCRLHTVVPSATRHTVVIRSTVVVNRSVPSLLNSVETTLSVWRRGGIAGLPDMASHTRAVLSGAAVTIKRPSGLNAAAAAAYGVSCRSG